MTMRRYAVCRSPALRSVRSRSALISTWAEEVAADAAVTAAPMAPASMKPGASARSTNESMASNLMMHDIAPVRIVAARGATVGDLCRAGVVIAAFV